MLLSRGAAMVPIKDLASCNPLKEPFFSRNFSHLETQFGVKGMFPQISTNDQGIFVSHQHSVSSFIPICSLLLSIAGRR